MLSQSHTDTRTPSIDLGSLFSCCFRNIINAHGHQSCCQKCDVRWNIENGPHSNNYHEKNTFPPPIDTFTCLNRRKCNVKIDKIHIQQWKCFTLAFYWCHVRLFQVLLQFLLLFTTEIHCEVFKCLVCFFLLRLTCK